MTSILSTPQRVPDRQLARSSAQVKISIASVHEGRPSEPKEPPAIVELSPN